MIIYIKIYAWFALDFPQGTSWNYIRDSMHIVVFDVCLETFRHRLCNGPSTDTDCLSVCITVRCFCFNHDILNLNIDKISMFCYNTIIILKFVIFIKMKKRKFIKYGLKNLEKLCFLLKNFR